MSKQNTVPGTAIGRVTAAELRLEVTDETAQVLRGPRTWRGSGRG